MQQILRFHVIIHTIQIYYWLHGYDQQFIFHWTDHKQITVLCIHIKWNTRTEDNPNGNVYTRFWCQCLPLSFIKKKLPLKLVKAALFCWKFWMLTVLSGTQFLFWVSSYKPTGEKQKSLRVKCMVYTVACAWRECVWLTDVESSYLNKSVSLRLSLCNITVIHAVYNNKLHFHYFALSEWVSSSASRGCLRRHQLVHIVLLRMQRGRSRLVH